MLACWAIDKIRIGAAHNGGDGKVLLPGVLEQLEDVIANNDADLAVEDIRSAHFPRRCVGLCVIEDEVEKSSGFRACKPGFSTRTDSTCKIVDEGFLGKLRRYLDIAISWRGTIHVSGVQYTRTAPQLEGGPVRCRCSRALRTSVTEPKPYQQLLRGCRFAQRDSQDSRGEENAWIGTKFMFSLRHIASDV